MVGKSRRSQERYSYRDYLNWPSDERFELIDGQVYAMNAPVRVHQKFCMELSRQFANHFVGHKCEVYAAPFDVRLAKAKKKDHEIFTVVQPDISIVCDGGKLDERGCLGAPDMIVEIISETTSSYDHITKKNLYEKAGVKEYWLIHPVEHILWIYCLENGKYSRVDTLPLSGKVSPFLFPDLIIDLDLLRR